MNARTTRRVAVLSEYLAQFDEAHASVRRHIDRCVELARSELARSEVAVAWSEWKVAWDSEQAAARRSESARIIAAICLCDAARALLVELESEVGSPARRSAP